MSDWKPRRFWKSAQARQVAGGFDVRLDTRELRTPAKAPLVVPTLALAEAIASEWDAQEGEIDPQAMPMTRTANSAVDKVVPQRGAVADHVAEYGENDLLCYRAETPRTLRERQEATWDPWLKWADERLGARLRSTQGIIHVGQDDQSLGALRARVHELSAFELAAFHDLVGLSGSLILGFAAALHPEKRSDVWQHSRLDEAWQEEKWGKDDEASASAEVRAQAFFDAARFYDLCK